jgi:hypothetical protein
MIELTISGPGGTFYYELSTIIAALIEEGFDLDVHDSEFDPNYPTKSLEEYREYCNQYKLKKGKIVIRTNHVPWGG